MHVTHPRICIATFVVFAATLSAREAHADKNEIRAVTFDDDGATTRVNVRGATTPTFTVYKLERPSRVVIDVPQARLGEALRGHEGAATFTPSTWAVSTIAAQQIDDGGQVVRVIVTLARPGRYDVKTDGNNVVVMVTARDPAPKLGVDPKQAEALAKAQAESATAKQAAANADQARARAEQASLAAQAEAERLRKAAEVAQRAADEAKRSGNKNTAELEKANRAAQIARDEAAKAKSEAARAQAAAEQAQRVALADAAKAKADADRTRVEAGESVAKAKADADRTRVEASESVAKARAEADQAKRDAERARAEIAKASDTAARTKAEADAAKADAARMKAEAQATRLELEAARREAAQRKAEADAARNEAHLAKQNMTRTARTEVEAAKAEAERAREEARIAKAEAEAVRTAAAADKQRAEAAKADAAKTLADAKAQLATLEKRTQSAQSMEDKARAAHAAAVAREESAREIVAKAAREREAAEQAAMKAAEARDRSSSQVASERAKLISEAKAAEERLAKATRATEEAEARRTAAENAADSARKQLDTTRTTLASVEQQRGAAEQAAREAARLRGEAEAAVSDAKRRRSEAELAADQAARRRSEAESAAEVAARRRTEAEAAAQTASAQRSAAEQQRTAAEQQRKAAEAAARDADKQRAIAEAAARDADKQRTISETAAKKAVASKHDAEQSLEELLARRAAAERAAQALEARSKAEAKAQAELAAAQARQAGEAELAKVRREAARLADERKRAEDELADRRKAVATQQAQAERLKTEAAQARDAAEREEQRRSQLAAQRVTEEKELAKLQAQKAAIAAKPAPVATPVAAAPVVTAPATKAAFVKDITFKGSDVGGSVDIALTGEGKVTAGEVSATHAELIIDGAELASKLERKLDVRKFGGPVRAVSSFRDRRTPNRVRLVAELDAPARASFDRDATGIRWTFSGTTAPKATAKATRTQNLPPPVVGGFGAASTPITQQSVSQVPQAPRNRKVYRGAIVDLDYKDAPIHDLLRQLAMTGKVNIVVPEGVDAKVSVVLKKVPWDQALEVILASHGLWYRRDGNLFRVAPRKELDAEDEAEAARREALVKSEVPRSEVVPLNYSSATDLKPKLEAMLSPKGRIEVDDRTNALIINDVAGNREQISRLALQLDTQTPQISIEARIVEARSTFLRQIGIQWGGRASMSAAGGNATGLLFPSSIGIAGGNEDAQTNRNGVATPSDFAINLPAATGSGEGGAIGMSLGSVGGNFNINLRLSALEDTGTVRIISAPKITVLNNKEASISQGVSIPISVVSAAGTQTQFVQADLSLKVKPYVSQRDCAIAMDLAVTKNEPDFVNVGARGDPTILRKEAKTSMLVNDGETSVLGGIYTRNTGLAYKKVPFFGDLPVLGWFFKNRRENDDRTEILVFITPKITNKALLRCQ
jgi:type IV pilus assembly protein PilQ